MHPDDPDSGSHMMEFVANTITWCIALVLCIAGLLWWGVAS